MFELASKPTGYFGKMNSTLGSVVPLAMFLYFFKVVISEIFLSKSSDLKMNSTLGSVVPLAMFSSAYGRVFSLVKQTEEKKCSTFFVLCQLPAACLS